MRIRLPVPRQIENRAGLFVLGVFFRAVLELSYRDFVVPWYEYSGFTMADNVAKYLESWILYIGLLLLLPARARKPSDFLVGLAFFGYLTPLLVFYGCADASRWALYSVLAQYAILSLVCSGRRIHIPTIKHGPAMSLGLATAGIALVTGWMIASGGLATFNLNLEAVYEFREAAGSTINVGVFSYLIVWVTTVCGPLLLMLALRDGRRVLALSVVLLHVFWFGITSHKAVLFFPALIVFLYMLFKHSRALSLIPLGMSLLVMISLASYYTTENLLLSALLVRRIFFTSSHLTFTYLEFFQDNPFVYWSNSFLSGLVNYPYDESVALVIGTYLGTPDAWANNSFFSTGYMHAGLLGVVFYGLAAGVLLRILDSLVTRTVPMWMSLSVVVVPFFTLFTSADLTTALLTHGLGFAMFMLYLMKVPSDPHGSATVSPLTTASTSRIPVKSASV